MAETRITILGAGPAGLAAAMQLRRQGQDPLLLERSAPGGLLHNANWVENYPGFPGGISGRELVGLMLAQARKLGVEVVPSEVEQVVKARDGFRIETNQGLVTAEIVVAATGTVPRHLEGVQVERAARSDLFYHVVPLLDLSGQEILIIGAGDAALDYALNLADCNRVSIFNRGIRVKGLKLLRERVEQHQEIRYFENHQVHRVERTGNRRLRITVEKQGKMSTLEVDAVLAAVGRQPALDYVGPGLVSSLETLRKEGRFYLIGDVHNERYRQTAIAVGDGIRAAMEIDRSLPGG